MTEKLKLGATTDKTPEDEFKRRAFYTRKAREKDKEDVESFKESIVKGKHSEKCLDCYIAGLRWCIYWSDEKLCTEFEKKEMEQAFIDFR
jgi:hypothetical protein